LFSGQDEFALLDTLPSDEFETLLKDKNFRRLINRESFGVGPEFAQKKHEKLQDLLPSLFEHVQFRENDGSLTTMQLVGLSY
jgi:hypothetical protein